MVYNTSALYKLNKEALSSFLHNLYINDKQAFISVVNTQLNSWDRFNIIRLFNSKTYFTVNDFKNALLS